MQIQIRRLAVAPAPAASADVILTLHDQDLKERCAMHAEPVSDQGSSLRPPTEAEVAGRGRS